MKNYKEESCGQNPQESTEHINYAPNTQSAILGTTSQCKVKTKIEICLCDEQHSGLRMLFSDYGLPVPTWLRKKFIVNQYRRKCLNDNLREAQLDKAFCGKWGGTNEWWDSLHSVWHDINGRPLCK